MTNLYFTNPNNLLPNTRATAGAVTSDFDAVAAAFDQLPTPNNIKRGQTNYSADTGTVNAFVATEPAIPGSAFTISDLVDGVLVSVKAANTNTGASTLNVSSTGTKPLLRPDGTPLVGNEIQTGQFFDARYNLSLASWVLVALNVYPAANAGTAVTTAYPDNSTKIATTAYVTTGLALKANVTDTHNAASKATPADADEMPIQDSASAFSLAKLTWANLRAALMPYMSRYSVVGSVRNLKMSISAASAIATITADEIIVETALGGNTYKLASFNKTVNLATTGAGGMDVGTAPISGYVALYVIYNPATNTSAVLATNGNAVVSEIYGGANMPAGYTASALISVWPTNASSLLVQGFQYDRNINTLPVVVLNTTAAATVWTSLSIAGAVPPNAKNAIIIAAQNAPTTTVFALYLGPYSNGAVWFTCAGSIYVWAVMPMVTPQTIYYNVNISGNASTISVEGYVI